MALSSTAITTLARAKGFLRLNDVSPSFHRGGIDIYYDRNVGTTASAATVEVRDTDLVLAGTNDAPSTDFTYDLTAAANDTITELVAVINAEAGSAWVATALYHGDADTNDLVAGVSASAFGIAARQTLQIRNNRFVELLIEASTIEIETWLGRDIASRNYSELHNMRRAGGTKELVLRHPDVTAVTRVSLDSSRAMTVTYTGTDESARVEVSSTAVRTISRTGATTTDTSSTFAGNVTIAAMVTAIDAIGGGWDAVTVTDGPSAFLVREGVRDCLDHVIDLYSWDDYEGDYVVDYDAGTIDFDGWVWPYSLRINPPSVARLQIDYTAGFATIPADIDLIALEMVVALFHNVARDNSIQSQSLGDFSETMVLTSGSTRSFDWQRRLEKYRRWLP